MKTKLVFIVSTLALCVTAVVSAQQGVDPVYLRQYYQQLQQQQQSNDATPIYEQNSEQSQQYVTAGQQLRVRDNVAEQVRAQQQQANYVAPAVRDYLQQQPQYQQPQQALYHQSQAAAAPAPRRNQPAYKLKNAAPNEEEYDDHNSSYQFGFDVKDDEFTNYQNRKEVRDGAVIKGSYSVVDSDGFIRTVKYTADPKQGFKAEVIREPTDIVVKIPTPAPQQLLRGGGHKAQEYSAKQQYHAEPQHYHQYQ